MAKASDKPLRKLPKLGLYVLPTETLFASRLHMLLLLRQPQNAPVDLAKTNEPQAILNQELIHVVMIQNPIWAGKNLFQF